MKQKLIDRLQSGVWASKSQKPLPMTPEDQKERSVDSIELVPLQSNRDIQTIINDPKFDHDGQFTQRGTGLKKNSH